MRDILPDDHSYGIVQFMEIITANFDQFGITVCVQGDRAVDSGLDQAQQAGDRSVVIIDGLKRMAQTRTLKQETSG